MLDPAYGQTTLLIPIDHKGEPPSGQSAYMPNEGQLTNLQGGLARDILFYSIQSAPQMFFAKNQMYFVLGARDTSITTPDTLYRVGMRFIGNTANQNSVPVAREELPDFWNFVLGHCGDGIFGVHASRRIIYPSVYPGIDFHAYSNPWGPKFYLVMHPGSTPQNVKMEFEGQDSLALDLLGQLKAYKHGRAITLPKGLCYQQINGSTQLVNASVNYSIGPGQAYASFQYGTYNPAYPLIIDISASLGALGGGTDAEPEWASFYGHTETDYPTDAALLSDATLLVCGNTTSPEFPLLNEQFGFFDGGQDAYYSEFDPLYARVYTTLFGGNGSDQVMNIGVSSDESSVFLFGSTLSSNLPILQNGSGFYDNTTSPPSDWSCYVSRFSRGSIPIGVREWVSYFGSGIGSCNCMKVDGANNVHIIGKTEYQGAPFGVGICQGTSVFFPICDPPGSADYHQDVVLGSTDVWYARFDASTNLSMSTFFGGAISDQSVDMAIDNATGRVYILGNTTSPRVGTPNCAPPANGTFPLCNQAGGYFQSNLNGDNSSGVDVYVACLSATGVLEWSTYFGSRLDELALAIGVNFAGDIYISGITQATAYSTTACAPPGDTGFPNCASGDQAHYARSSAELEGFVAKFDGTTHALVWSTFINANVESFVPDEGGNMVMALSTFAGSGGIAPLPTQPKPNHYYQPLHTDGLDELYEAMVHSYTTSDELEYGTYFGGHGGDGAAKALPWVGGRLYLVGGSGSTSSFPFHCPPTPDPYCYNTYGTQNTSGEAFYAQLMYDVTIGIDDEQSTALGGGEVFIYPNPTEGVVTILLGEEWVRNGSPTVSIYDATGRLLANELPLSYERSGKLQYELGGLGQGLRFIRLRSSDGGLSDSRSIIVR